MRGWFCLCEGPAPESMWMANGGVNPGSVFQMSVCVCLSACLPLSLSLSLSRTTEREIVRVRVCVCVYGGGGGGEIKKELRFQRGT